MSKTNSLMIGRFQVVKPLGRGIQGSVYLARDPDLDRLVAIKLLNEIPGQSTAEGESWAQARNLARLRHPNIVALFELGKFHSFTFLVFEYLEGKLLREELTSMGAFEPALAYGTMLQLTDAMAYAHAKGILHLDLNPNNVMRDEAQKVRITDFDLSRRAGVSTRSAALGGTLPYLTPEHFLDGELDTRTDVYALGQMFYELLTGNVAVPIAEDEVMRQWILHQSADPAPLLAKDPHGHLSAVIARATNKQKEARYAHAGEMRDALLQAWEKMRVGVDLSGASHHGTVTFVLSRIARRGDFPAMSKTLAEINLLTSGESQAPVARLSAAILRDVALTSRLLKLANSSYYARVSGKVNTVTEAVKLLGVEQVRLTCNGLACFGQFAGRKQDLALREACLAAFIAGLVARHLYADMKKGQVEEAFLAAMLFNLGKMLTMYYFNDDFQDIEALRAQGASPDEAVRTVMGISYAEIGHGVGSTWNLPTVVLEVMRDSDVAQADPPLAAAARFATQLMELDADSDPTASQVLQLSTMLKPYLTLNLTSIHALLGAAMEKFKVFAPALEVDLHGSQVVRRLEHWLASIPTEPASDIPAPAPTQPVCAS